MTVTHPIRLQCREVVEHVSDLLGGELAPEDLVRLEQHLLVCPPCTIHVHQVRETIALAAETRATTPPPASALDAFRRWKAKP
jgi:hypothetical protein